MTTLFNRAAYQVIKGKLTAASWRAFPWVKNSRKPHATSPGVLSQGIMGFSSAAAKQKEVKVEFPSKWVTHKCDGPRDFTTTTAEELLGFFREMTTIRRMEIAADNLYKLKKIRGFLHLYNGQEAIASGLESALTPQDQVITAYRDHAFVVTRRCGGKPSEVLAELCGKKTGCSQGKGGSMHMYRPQSGFFGGNGIVGAQTPLGTGIAFANKYLKNGHVCVTMYGDGAANQGQLYEAFNMAALWHLPVIYVCENNQYAMGTSTKRASYSQSYYSRGDYIPGIQVDAMDVLQVKEAGIYAVEFAKTQGPILLEMKTYRYYGHSMSDPGTTYRSREEIDAVRKKSDPINKLKDKILTLNLATKEDLEGIEKEVKLEIEEAIKFAEESPVVPPEDLFSNIFVEPTTVRATELINTHYVK